MFPNAFDPIKSNFESLSKAKSKCMNPFWKEVYSALLDCRLNGLLNHPDEKGMFPLTVNPTSPITRFLLGKNGPYIKTLMQSSITMVTLENSVTWIVSENPSNMSRVS